MALPANTNYAFRLAYDKLNEHFPPENTDEFAKKVLNEFRELYVQSGEDMLVKKLLYAVYDYLDEYARRTAIQEYYKDKESGLL